MTSHHPSGRRRRSSASSGPLPEVPLTRAELEAEAGEVAQTSVSPSELLQEQKDLASDRLFAVAEAFRDTARQLLDQEELGAANLAEQAADRFERISGYVRENDLRDVVDDAQDLARRHPVLVLGGLFVAGALLGRFLRASSRHPAYDEADEDEPEFIEEELARSRRTPRAGRAPRSKGSPRRRRGESAEPSMSRQYGSIYGGMTPPTASPGAGMESEALTREYPPSATGHSKWTDESDYGKDRDVP